VSAGGDAAMQLGGEAEVAARAAAEISGPRRFLWSLRRELWESRAIYVAPLAVAALIVVAAMLGDLQLADKMRAAAALTPMARHEAVVQHYLFASLLLMATTFVVAVFYCLDAFQSERRDRSILFWKSLPVSDTTTVLAKASIPLVILPLLTVALTFVVHLVMLLVGSAALAASGQAGALWSEVDLPQTTAMVLYHMVTVHALWYAPIYAWLLLVSAWANRVPWLWATLPLLAIGTVERIALGSRHVAHFIGNRFAGRPEGADFTTTGSMLDPLMRMTPGRFLVSPGFWLGLVVAAAFLAAAVRLRRSRGPV
jgi:ABC-2 type transport system permease protein